MPKPVEMTEAQYDLHEPDEWLTGTVVDVEDVPDNGFGDGYKWVINMDGEDREVWAFCSNKLTERTKLYGWLKGLDPDSPPQLGVKVDWDKVIGRRVEVMFEHQEKDGVLRDKPVKIRAEKKKGTQTPLQKKQAETSAAKKPAARDTTEFAGDEAPF